MKRRIVEAALVELVDMRCGHAVSFVEEEKVLCTYRASEIEVGVVCEVNNGWGGGGGSVVDLKLKLIVE